MSSFTQAFTIARIIVFNQSFMPSFHLARTTDSVLDFMRSFLNDCFHECNDNSSFSSALPMTSPGRLWPFGGLLHLPIVVILHPERSLPSQRHTTRIALPRRNAAATADREESLDFGKPILMIFGGMFCVRFIPSSDGSELYLCPTTCRLSDKGARPAGPLRRSRVAPLFD